MSEVPAALRKSLVQLARQRCCLHRRFFIEKRPDFVRSGEVLDVHHVKFQACGGGNEESNLVPLCPTCHQGIHRGRVTIATDELLGIWSRWKNLRQTVPSEIFIGDNPSGPSVTAVMDVYGLESAIRVDPTVPYGTFRSRLLAATVYSLRTSDPFFPFNRSAPWSVSSDPHATRGRWDDESAVLALRASEQPLRFEINVPIALGRRPPQPVGSPAASRRL